MTGTEALFGPVLDTAHAIRNRVREELGFTVNIGVAPNRLLAKMASDFEKPDKVHLLPPEDVPARLWPLPVQALFGVGPSAARRLNGMGICTIGELAARRPGPAGGGVRRPGGHFLELRPTGGRATR